MNININMGPAFFGWMGVLVAAYCFGGSQALGAAAVIFAIVQFT